MVYFSKVLQLLVPPVIQPIFDVACTDKHGAETRFRHLAGNIKDGFLLFMQGWIKIHRQLSGSKLWLEEPFTRGQAWLDLILLANHKDGWILVRGIKMDIKRGQVGWSQVTLARRWRWSQGKVKRYLKLLENVEQIEQQKNNISLLITLKNYDKYQNNGEQTGMKRRANGEQTEPNNNDNNDNNSLPIGKSDQSTMGYEQLEDSGITYEEENAKPKKKRSNSKAVGSIVLYYFVALGKKPYMSKTTYAIGEHLFKLAREVCDTDEKAIVEVKKRIDEAKRHYESNDIKEFGLVKVYENWDKILTDWNKKTIYE